MRPEVADRLSPFGISELAWTTSDETAAQWVVSEFFSIFITSLGFGIKLVVPGQVQRKRLSSGFTIEVMEFFLS